MFGVLDRCQVLTLNYLQSFLLFLDYPEDGGSKLLWNVSNYSPST